jgi:hypothetical protein
MKILIVSLPRSGSTFFESKLYNHLSGKHEKTKKMAKEYFSPMSWMYNDNNEINTLQSFKEEINIYPNYTLRIMNNHVYYIKEQFNESIFNFLHNKIDINILFERKNFWDHLFSYYIARITDFNIAITQSKNKIDKVFQKLENEKINLTRLLEYGIWLRQKKEEIKTYCKYDYIINYEDFINNTLKYCINITGNSKSDNSVVTPVKQITRNKKNKLFINYNEAEQFIYKEFGLSNENSSFEK